MNKSYLIHLLNTDVAGNEERKTAFHRVGRNVMRKLADALQLSSTEYDLRSTFGPLTESGDITFHAQWVYVKLFQCRAGAVVLYRTCRGRRDNGSRNHHEVCAVGDLLDFDVFADRLVKLQLGASRRAAIDRRGAAITP